MSNPSLPSPLIPRQPVPPLQVPTLGHGSFCLAEHDLSLAKAGEWGLFISTSRGTNSIGIEEPAHFSAPGVFIVRPDGTLYDDALQTMPFARPHVDGLLAALNLAREKNDPARGEYMGAV